MILCGCAIYSCRIHIRPDVINGSCPPRVFTSRISHAEKFLLHQIQQRLIRFIVLRIIHEKLSDLIHGAGIIAYQESGQSGSLQFLLTSLFNALFSLPLLFFQRLFFLRQFHHIAGCHDGSGLYIPVFDLFLEVMDSLQLLRLCGKLGITPQKFSVIHIDATASALETEHVFI